MVVFPNCDVNGLIGESIGLAGFPNYGGFDLIDPLQL
jgi:hypothetical protein